MKIEVILLSFLLYWDAAYTEPRHQKLNDQIVSKVNRDSDDFKIIGRHAAERWRLNDGGVNLRERRAKEEDSSWSSWRGLYLDAEKRQEPLTLEPNNINTHKDSRKTSSSNHRAATFNPGNKVRNRRSIWKPFDLDPSPLSRDGISDAFKSGQATSAETRNEDSTLHKILEKPNTESNAHRASLYKGKFSDDIFDDFDDWFLLGRTFSAGDFTRTFYEPPYSGRYVGEGQNEHEEPSNGRTASKSHEISPRNEEHFEERSYEDKYRKEHRKDSYGNDKSDVSSSSSGKADESGQISGGRISMKGALHKGNKKDGFDDKKNKIFSMDSSEIDGEKFPWWNAGLYDEYLDESMEHHGYPSKHGRINAERSFRREYKEPKVEMGFDREYEPYSPRFLEKFGNEKDTSREKDRYLVKEHSIDDEYKTNQNGRHRGTKMKTGVKDKKFLTDSPHGSFDFKRFEDRRNEKLEEADDSRGFFMKSGEIDGNEYKNRFYSDGYDFDENSNEHWTKFGNKYDSSGKESNLIHNKKVSNNNIAEKYNFGTNTDEHWKKFRKKYDDSHQEPHLMRDKMAPTIKIAEEYDFDTNGDEHWKEFGKKYDNNHRQPYLMHNKKVPNNKIADHNLNTNRNGQWEKIGKKYEENHKEPHSMHDRKVPNNNIAQEYDFDTNKDEHWTEFGRRYDDSHKVPYLMNDKKIPKNKDIEEYDFDTNTDDHWRRNGKKYGDERHKELHSMHDRKVPNNKMDEEYHFDTNEGEHLKQFGKRYDENDKEHHSMHDRKVPNNKMDEEYHFDTNRDEHRPQFAKRFDDSDKELHSMHDRKVPNSKMDEEYNFHTNRDEHRPQFGKRFDDSYKESHSTHDRKVPNNKITEKNDFDTNKDEHKLPFGKRFDDSSKEPHSKRDKKVLNNKVAEEYDIQKSEHSTLHPKDHESERGSIESLNYKRIPTEFSLDHERTENKNIYEIHSPDNKRPPTEFSERSEKILNKENIEDKKHSYIPHQKESFIAATRNKPVENQQKQPQNKRHFMNVKPTNERDDYSSHNGTPDGKTNIHERANDREYRRKGGNLMKSMQIGESARRNTHVDGEEENASDKHQSVTAEISAGARIMANKRADAAKHRGSNGGKSTLKENEIAGEERKIENHSTGMHERAREDVRDSSREIEPSKERLDGKVNVNRGGADSAENRGEKWNFLDRGLKINRRNKSTRYELDEKTKSGLFDVENYERAESENFSREMDRRSSKEEEESEDRINWLPLERMHDMNHAKDDSKRVLIKDRKNFRTPLEKFKQFDNNIRFDGGSKKIKNSAEWHDKGSDDNDGFQRHEFKGGFLDDSHMDYKEDNKRINYNKSGKKQYLYGGANYDREKSNNIFREDEKEGHHNVNMEVNYRDVPITTEESEKKNSMKLYDLDEARSENKQKLFKKKSHEIFTKSETRSDNKSKEGKHHLKSGEMKEEHVNKYDRRNDFINSFNANRGMTHNYEEKESSEITENRGITDEDGNKSRMILEDDKLWDHYGNVKDDVKTASIMKEKKNIEDKDALVTKMKELKKDWMENVEANDNRVHHEVSPPRYLQDFNKDVKQTPNNPFHNYKRKINQPKEMLQKVSLKGEHSSKYNKKFNEMNDTDLKKGEDLHKKKHDKFNNEVPFDNNEHPSLEEEKRVELKEKEELKMYDEQEDRIFLRNRDAKGDEYSVYLKDKGIKVSPSLKTKARISTAERKTLDDEMANVDDKRHTEKIEENETPRKLNDYSLRQKNKENYKDESPYHKFNQADYFEKKYGRPNSKGENNKLEETTKIAPTINYLKDNDKSETLGSLNFKTVSKASQENSDISSEDTKTHEEDSRENKFNVHPERKDKLKVVKSGLNKNHNSKVRAFINNGTPARTFEKHDEGFAESEEEYVENGKENEFEAYSKEREKLQTMTPGWNENDGSKFVASKNIQTVVSVVPRNEETSSKDKVYVAGRPEPEYDSYLKDKQFQQLKEADRSPKNHNPTIKQRKNFTQDESKIVRNNIKNNEIIEKLNNHIYQQGRYENMRSGSKFIQEEQFGREYGGINEDKKGNIAFKDKKKLETVMYDLSEAPASANVVKVASTSQKDDEILLDRGAVYVPDAEGNESRFYSKNKEIRAQTGSSEGKTRTSGDGDDAGHKKSRVANGEDLERRKTLQPVNAKFLHRNEAANTNSKREENNDEVEMIKKSSSLKASVKTDVSNDWTSRRNKEKFHGKLSIASESDEEHFSKKYGLANGNSKVYNTGFQRMEKEKGATSDLNGYYESESMTTGDTQTISKKLKEDKEYFANDKYKYGKNPKEEEFRVHPEKQKKIHNISPDPNANQSFKITLSNPKTVSNNFHPSNDIISQNDEVHNNGITRHKSSVNSKKKNGTTHTPIPNKTYNSEMLSSKKFQSLPEKDANYEAINDKSGSHVELTAIEESTKTHEHQITERGSNVDHVSKVAATTNAETAADVSDSNGNDGSHVTAVEAHTTKVKENGIRGWRLNQGDVSEEQPAAGTHGVISPDESVRRLESSDANDQTYMKGREDGSVTRNFISMQKSRDNDNSDDVSGFLKTESVDGEDSNDTLNGTGAEDDKRGVKGTIGFDKHVEGVEFMGANDLMGRKTRKGKAGEGDLIKKWEKLGDDNFYGISGFLDTDNGNNEKIGGKVDKEESNLDGPKAEGEFGKQSTIVTNNFDASPANSQRNVKEREEKTPINGSPEEKISKVPVDVGNFKETALSSFAIHKGPMIGVDDEKTDAYDENGNDVGEVEKESSIQPIDGNSAAKHKLFSAENGNLKNRNQEKTTAWDSKAKQISDGVELAKVQENESNDNSEREKERKATAKEDDKATIHKISKNVDVNRKLKTSADEIESERITKLSGTSMSDEHDRSKLSELNEKFDFEQITVKQTNDTAQKKEGDSNNNPNKTQESKILATQYNNGLADIEKSKKMTASMKKDYEYISGIQEDKITFHGLNSNEKSHYPISQNTLLGNNDFEQIDEKSENIRNTSRVEDKEFDANIHTETNESVKNGRRIDNANSIPTEKKDNTAEHDFNTIPTARNSQSTLSDSEETRNRENMKKPALDLNESNEFESLSAADARMDAVKTANDEYGEGVPRVRDKEGEKEEALYDLIGKEAPESSSALNNQTKKNNEKVDNQKDLVRSVAEKNLNIGKKLTTDKRTESQTEENVSITNSEVGVDYNDRGEKSKLISGMEQENTSGMENLKAPDLVAKEASRNLSTMKNKLNNNNDTTGKFSVSGSADQEKNTTGEEKGEALPYDFIKKKEPDKQPPATNSRGYDSYTAQKQDKSITKITTASELIGDENKDLKSYDIQENEDNDVLSDVNNKSDENSVVKDATVAARLNKDEKSVKKIKFGLKVNEEPKHSSITNLQSDFNKENGENKILAGVRNEANKNNAIEDEVTADNLNKDENSVKKIAPKLKVDEGPQHSSITNLQSDFNKENEESKILGYAESEKNKNNATKDKVTAADFNENEESAKLSTENTEIDKYRNDRANNENTEPSFVIKGMNPPIMAHQETIAHDLIKNEQFDANSKSSDLSNRGETNKVKWKEERTLQHDLLKSQLNDVSTGDDKIIRNVEPIEGNNKSNVVNDDENEAAEEENEKMTDGFGHDGKRHILSNEDHGKNINYDVQDAYSKVNKEDQETGKNNVENVEKVQQNLNGNEGGKSSASSEKSISTSIPEKYSETIEKKKTKEHDIGKEEKQNNLSTENGEMNDSNGISEKDNEIASAAEETSKDDEKTMETAATDIEAKPLSHLIPKNNEMHTQNIKNVVFEESVSTDRVTDIKKKEIKAHESIRNKNYDDSPLEDNLGNSKIATNEFDKSGPSITTTNSKTAVMTDYGQIKKKDPSENSSTANKQKDVDRAKNNDFNKSISSIKESDPKKGTIRKENSIESNISHDIHAENDPTDSRDILNRLSETEPTMGIKDATKEELSVHNLIENKVSENLFTAGSKIENENGAIDKYGESIPAAREADADKVKNMEIAAEDLINSQIYTASSMKSVQLDGKYSESATARSETDANNVKEDKISMTKSIEGHVENEASNANVQQNVESQIKGFFEPTLLTEKKSDAIKNKKNQETRTNYTVEDRRSEELLNTDSQVEENNEAVTKQDQSTREADKAENSQIESNEVMRYGSNENLPPKILPTAASKKDVDIKTIENFIKPHTETFTTAIDQEKITNSSEEKHELSSHKNPHNKFEEKGIVRDNSNINRTAEISQSTNEKKHINLYDSKENIALSNTANNVNKMAKKKDGKIPHEAPVQNKSMEPNVEYTGTIRNLDKSAKQNVFSISDSEANATKMEKLSTDFSGDEKKEVLFSMTARTPTDNNVFHENDAKTRKKNNTKDEVISECPECVQTKAESKETEKLKENDDGSEELQARDVQTFADSENSEVNDELYKDKDVYEKKFKGDELENYSTGEKEVTQENIEGSRNLEKNNLPLDTNNKNYSKTIREDVSKFDDLKKNEISRSHPQENTELNNSAHELKNEEQDKIMHNSGKDHALADTEKEKSSIRNLKQIKLTDVYRKNLQERQSLLSHITHENSSEKGFTLKNEISHSPNDSTKMNKLFSEEKEFINLEKDKKETIKRPSTSSDEDEASSTTVNDSAENLDSEKRKTPLNIHNLHPITNNNKIQPEDSTEEKEYKTSATSARKLTDKPTEYESLVGVNKVKSQRKEDIKPLHNLITDHDPEVFSGASIRAEINTAFKEHIQSSIETSQEYQTTIAANESLARDSNRNSAVSKAINNEKNSENVSEETNGSSEDNNGIDVSEESETMKDELNENEGSKKGFGYSIRNEGDKKNSRGFNDLDNGVYNVGIKSEGNSANDENIEEDTGDLKGEIVKGVNDENNGRKVLESDKVDRLGMINDKRAKYGLNEEGQSAESIDKSFHPTDNGNAVKNVDKSSKIYEENGKTMTEKNFNEDKMSEESSIAGTLGVSRPDFIGQSASSVAIDPMDAKISNDHNQSSSNFREHQLQEAVTNHNDHTVPYYGQSDLQNHILDKNDDLHQDNGLTHGATDAKHGGDLNEGEKLKKNQDYNNKLSNSNMMKPHFLNEEDARENTLHNFSIGDIKDKMDEVNDAEKGKGLVHSTADKTYEEESNKNKEYDNVHDHNSVLSNSKTMQHDSTNGNSPDTSSITNNRDKNVEANNANEENDLIFANSKQTEKGDLGKNKKITNHPEYNSKPPNSKTMKPNSLNQNDSTESTSQNFNINDPGEADAHLNQSVVSIERMTKQHDSNVRHLDEKHVSASSSNPNREIMGNSDVYAGSEVSFAEANRERAMRTKGKTSFEVNAHDSKETKTDSEKNRYEVHWINEPHGKRKPSIHQQVQGIHLFARDAKTIDQGSVEELKKKENESETNRSGMGLIINQKPNEKDFTGETSTSNEPHDVIMNTDDNNRRKEETERSMEHDLNKNPSSKINSIDFSNTEGIGESSATDRKHKGSVQNELSALNTQTIASVLKHHDLLAKNSIHVHNLNLENDTKLHGTTNEENNTESNIVSPADSSNKDNTESLSKPKGDTSPENSKINPRSEGSSNLQNSISKEHSPPNLIAKTETPESQKHVKLNSSHENDAYGKSSVHNPKSISTATAVETDRWSFLIHAKPDDADEDTTPKHTSNTEYRHKVMSTEERERNLSLATSSPAESVEVTSADKSDVAYGDSDKDRDLSTKLITEIDDDEEGGDQINTRVKDDSVTRKPEDGTINDTRRHDGESVKADETSGDDDIKNKRKEYQLMFSVRHYKTDERNRQTGAANYNSDSMTKGSLEKDYDSKDGFGMSLSKTDPLLDKTVDFSVKEIDDKVGNKILLRVERLESSNANSKEVINSHIIKDKKEMEDLSVPDTYKTRQNSFAKSNIEKSKLANRELVSELDEISGSHQRKSQETSLHQPESDEGTESNHPNWNQVSGSDASESQPRLELYTSKDTEFSKDNTSDELHLEHKTIKDTTVNNEAHKKFNYTTIEKVRDLKLQNINADKLGAKKNMDRVNKISNDIKNELNRALSDQSKPEKILKMKNANGALPERDLQAIEVKLNENGKLNESEENNSLERKRCKADECTENYDADLHDNQFNSLNTVNEMKNRRKYRNKFKNFLNPRRKFIEWHVNVESNQYNTDLEKYLTSDDFYHKSLDSKMHDNKGNYQQKNIVSKTSSTASPESSSEDKISKEKESTNIHKHNTEKQNESSNDSNKDHLRKLKEEKSARNSNVEHPTEEINSSKFNARKIEDVTEGNAESPFAVNKIQIAKLQVLQHENETRESKENGSSEVSAIGTTYKKSIYPIDSQHPQISKEEVKTVTHKLQRDEGAGATENAVKMVSSKTYTVQEEKQKNMLNDEDKNQNSKMITPAKVDRKNEKVDGNDYGILKESIGTSKGNADYDRWLLWRKYYSKIKKIDSILLKKIKPYFAGIQEFENEDRYLRKYKELYEKFTSMDNDSLGGQFKECDYSGNEAVDDLDKQYFLSSTTTDNKSHKFDRKNLKDWPWFSTKSIDPSLQAKGGSSLNSVDTQNNDFHYSSDNGKSNEKFPGSMPHFQKVRLPSDEEDSNNEFESKGHVGSSEFVRSNVGLSCGGKLGLPVSMSSIETQSSDEEGSRRIVAAESAGIAELRKSEVINDVLQTTSESVTSRQVPQDDVKSKEVGDIYGDVSSDVKEEDVNRRTAVAVKSADASAGETKCRFKVPAKEKVDVYIVRRKSRGPVRVTHLRGTTPRLVSYGLIPKKVYERTLDIFAKSKIFSKPYPVRSISR